MRATDDTKMICKSIDALTKEIRSIRLLLQAINTKEIKAKDGNVPSEDMLYADSMPVIHSSDF